VIALWAMNVSEAVHYVGNASGLAVRDRSGPEESRGRGPLVVVLDKVVLEDIARRGVTRRNVEFPIDGAQVGMDGA
jgi:hypothetical protein